MKYDSKIKKKLYVKMYRTELLRKFLFLKKPDATFWILDFNCITGTCLN